MLSRFTPHLRSGLVPSTLRPTVSNSSLLERSLPSPRHLSIQPPTPSSQSSPPPSILPIDSLPRYPTASPTGLLRLMDYIGTIAFSHSGALLAATSGMDLFGVCMVGTITAVGGGTIRDAVILSKSPFWTTEIEYLYISILTALATFTLWPREKSDDSIPHFLGDTIGVAGFCVIGAMNGVRSGVSGGISVLCGMSTATFGGVVRDVFIGREVRILHSRAEIYATVAAGGGAAYLTARKMGFGGWGRVVTGLGVAALGRLVAWEKGVILPTWENEELKGTNKIAVSAVQEESRIGDGKVNLEG